MRRRGFTMIEILIVVSIIVTLAAILIPVVTLIQKQSLRVKNESLLQKVHAGLLEYRDIYTGFPPTAADPLVGNRLAHYLCTASDAVDRSARSSAVLVGEIPVSQIQGEAIVDYYVGRPLIYVSTRPGSTNPRTPVPLPERPGSDSSSLLTEAYEGYTDIFELWSAGPDREIDPVRNAAVNTDNLIVTEPYGELRVF